MQMNIKQENKKTTNQHLLMHRKMAARVNSNGTKTKEGEKRVHNEAKREINRSWFGFAI